MGLVADFLDRTSIHGLRYLSNAETRGNPVVAAVWLVCIAGSFSAAAVVIYYNVHNWENSPSIISKAQPVLIEESEVPMPTITFCPGHPSFTYLMVNYFNKYYDHTRSRHIDNAIKAKILKDEILARADSEVKSLSENGLTPLEGCLEVTAKANSSRPCAFVRLIRGMDYATRKYCYAADKSFLADYVVGKMISGSSLSLEDLEAFYEKKCGVQVDDHKLKPTRSYQRMHSFYSVFFPLLKSVDGKELNDLEALEDFDGYSSVPNIDKFPMGDLFGQMLNRGLVGNDLAKNLTEMLVEDIVKRLDVDGVNTGDSLMEFLSYFTYDHKDQTILAKHNGGINLQGCNASSGAVLDCNGDDVLSSGCADYCKLVNSGRRSEELVQEIFRMSMEDYGPLEIGKPRSLLPDCSWENSTEKGNCWRKVVIDRGICYTNYYSGSVMITDVKGHETGQGFLFDEPSEVLQLDVSWAFNDWFAHHPFNDLLITPRGHFTIGRLAIDADSTVRFGQAFRDRARLEDIKITFVNIVKTTDDFRGMSPLKRNCYYPDEIKLDFFPEYSEANCALECAWKLANQTCRCIPWFLRGHFPEADLCEVFGNKCFKDLVDGRYKLDECMRPEMCLPDCEVTEMRLDREYSNLPERSFCTDLMPANILPLEKESMCGYYEAKIGPGNSSDMERILNSQNDYWLRRMKGSLSYTRVYVHRKTAMKILMTATISFIDVISNIGGTLGLFSGLSVLSAAEIVFWAGRFAGKHWEGRDKKRNRKSKKGVL